MSGATKKKTRSFRRTLDRSIIGKARRSAFLLLRGEYTMDLSQILKAGVADLEKRAEALAPESPDEHPLVTQYRDLVRKVEMGGTAMGGLGGIGLGLLGRKLLGQGAMLPVLGGAFGGLAGKQLGRRGGEELGATALTQQTGVPWEV